MSAVTFHLHLDLFAVSRPGFRSRSSLAAILLLVVASGCAPSTSMLYRDYEIASGEPPVAERVARALAEAGWETHEGDSPNAVATSERRISNWGIYSVVVSLEAVPVGGDYVRLFFYPYRKYFTGSRSKIPFMKRSLRRALMGDINEAFEANGLVPLGTSVERDREAEAP